MSSRMVGGYSTIRKSGNRFSEIMSNNKIGRDDDSKETIACRGPAKTLPAQESLRRRGRKRFNRRHAGATVNPTTGIVAAPINNPRTPRWQSQRSIERSGADGNGEP